VTQDFQRIPEVAAVVIGKVGDEPTFPFPEVLDVIRLCSANGIAVLGVELFRVKQDGHYAAGSSAYDTQHGKRWRSLQDSQWQDYVQYNNTLAEEFARKNPLGEDHVYVLTTASWVEFRELQKTKAL